MKDWITTQEMAEELGVSRSMVQARALKRGIGKVMGGARFFERSDIEKMQPSKMGNFRKKT